MDSEELQHLHTLRAKYVRNLHRLQEQEADYGLNVPLEIANNITKFEELIQRVDADIAHINTVSAASTQSAIPLKRQPSGALRKSWLLRLLSIGIICVALFILFLYPALTNVNGSSQPHVFEFKNPQVNMFYSLNDASFSIANDMLHIKGRFDQGVYIDKKIPANFTAQIKFRTDDPSSEFLLGLTDGVNQAKNYTINIVPSGTELYMESYYPTISNTQEQFRIKPNKIFNIVAQRNEGVLKIFVNDNLFITYSNNPSMVNKYDYIFLTSSKHVIVNGVDTIIAGEITILDIDITQPTK